MLWQRIVCSIQYFLVEFQSDQTLLLATVAAAVVLLCTNVLLFSKNINEFRLINHS